MNVLMISTNRNNQPMAVLPLGACMVAEAARAAGHTVRMLDFMFKDDPTVAVEDELRHFAPEVVGISLRNIDNNDLKDTAVYFKGLPVLIQRIERAANAKTVLGGAAVGVMPEALLRYSGAACAIVGPGEVTFPGLLAAFARGEFPRDLPGLAWLDDGVFHQNPPAPTSAFSEQCAVPDFRQWIDLEAYQAQLSTVPIESKRGCSFECVYCTYALAEGHRHYEFSPESVVAQIQRLIASGLLDIEFVDNVFNAPYEHAMAICRGLAKTWPRPRLQTLELNPRFIDDALLTAMEQAGFVGIGITAESTADPVLTGLNKGFDAERVRQVAECVRRHGIPCAWIFMLGGPGETPATVQQTLDFAAGSIRPTDIAFFNVGIRIYPGTGLERIARDQGVLTVPAAEMLNPVFYVAPNLDREWLTQTLDDALATHMNFLSSDTLSHSLVPKIHRLAYRLGMKQPVWRHTRAIRRGLRLVGMNV